VFHKDVGGGLVDMTTTDEYLNAFVLMRLRRPWGEEDLFAKINCIGCGSLLVYDHLDLEDPELDPAWCFCVNCKSELDQFIV